MTPVEQRQRRFISACLEGTLAPTKRGAIAAAAARVSDWSGFEQTAEAHAVAPIVAARIKTKEFLVPNDVKRALAGLALRHRFAQVIRSRCVTEIAQALNSESIDFVALKGFALAHLAYPEPAMRPMRDVDLLINKRDIASVVQLLRDLDYKIASGHLSKYMRGHHHLPEASKIVKGLHISVEIHHDALSPDSPGSITLANLTAEPQLFLLESGRQLAALSHVDMLRHLCRHAFEPAGEIRYIHLMDLAAYTSRFVNEIDWPLLYYKFPAVVNTLACVYSILNYTETTQSHLPPPRRRSFVEAGLGMKPLSEILQESRTPVQMLRDLLSPPAWWQHGYYGIHPDHSLTRTRCLTHPMNVAKWLSRRALAAFAAYHEDL